MCDLTWQEIQRRYERDHQPGMDLEELGALDLKARSPEIERLKADLLRDFKAWNRRAAALIDKVSEGAAQ